MCLSSYSKRQALKPGKRVAIIKGSIKLGKIPTPMMCAVIVFFFVPASTSFVTRTRCG